MRTVLTTSNIMSLIVSNCQHCDEQFQTLSCVHFMIFSVIKLDLFIRALLLDWIHAMEKNTRTRRVHLVYFMYIVILAQIHNHVVII